MGIKKHIPNTITCCNLVSGCIATTFAFAGNPKMAMFWIIMGAVFDFFDGMVARLLKVSSPIGKELDSLADDVSFGLAPGVAVYSYLFGCPAVPWAWLPFVGFLLSVFSALRLAKFNIDERQTTSFIGLPTPANAIFWMFTVASLSHYHLLLGRSGVLTMVIAVLVFSWLLVSEVPMFSLKFHDFTMKNNTVRYLFLLLSLLYLVTAFVLPQCSVLLAFPIIILFYILLSIVHHIASK
jgi:CDP-diacylglycerol--serine O-phosphatidyltransferase